MRKQYHFWPGDQGLDAWDVDRLIQLTRELPVQQVELASIWEVDTVYWFGEGSDRPTVRNIVDHVRLILEVDRSYPIILGVNGRVMDGMHRIRPSLLHAGECRQARPRLTRQGNLTCLQAYPRNVCGGLLAPDRVGS